jgi:hypothetical protein
MTQYLVFLDANNEGVLWKSNGATASSTASPMAGVESGEPLAPVAKPGSGGSVDPGVLAVGIYAGDSVSTSDSDLVFWDGNSAPQLLSGVPKAPATGLYPSSLTPWSGAVYFSGLNQGAGQDLWMSKGKVSDTVPVTASNLTPTSLALAFGKLFFNGATFNAIGEPTGNALFSYDSVHGAVAIPNPSGYAANLFNPTGLAASPIGGAPYYPFPFSPLHGGASGPVTPNLPVTLFMGGTGADAVTVGLYGYNGSATSLIEAGPAAGGLVPTNIVSMQWISAVDLFRHILQLYYHSAIFFSGVGSLTGLDQNIPMRGLWMSQGTAATTLEVYEGPVSGVSLDPDNLTPLNGTLYFTGFDGERGRGLFAYNVVAKTTTLLFSSDNFDFSPGFGVQGMAAFENKLYFNCIPGASGQSQGLYVWDPTQSANPSLVSGTADTNPVSLMTAAFN